jgi:Gly-Xaa carboxypeptidase
MAHATKIIMPLTEKFNFSLTAFGIAYTDPSLPTWASLVLSDAFGTALEPAPLTPYVGPDSTAYQILSGTIKSTYNAHRSINGDHIKVQPGYMTGNTDTRFYWDLSHSIFRYNHHNYIGMKTLGNIHTVNESIATDAFFEMIKFFTTLILNADEAQNL